MNMVASAADPSNPLMIYRNRNPNVQTARQFCDTPPFRSRAACRSADDVKQVDVGTVQCTKDISEKGEKLGAVPNVIRNGSIDIRKLDKMVVEWS